MAYGFCDEERKNTALKYDWKHRTGIHSNSCAAGVVV